MWQVMRSCFRFDQNTKRVSRLFYCASICLFEHKSTTNHTASITPTYPQEVVITYTIVCSSRQAASNPIGLNLHLDFARLSYIIFHGKPTLQSYKYSKVLQTCICIYSYIAYCQVSDQTPQWLPIARGLCRTPVVDATQQEDIVCHSAGRHCGQALTEARSPSSSVGTATRSSSWRKDIPQW